MFVTGTLEFGQIESVDPEDTRLFQGRPTIETGVIRLPSLAVYQPQYPTSNVIRGVERLILSRDKRFFE